MSPIVLQDAAPSLLEATRSFHEGVRRGVAEVLAQAGRPGGRAQAASPLGEGAGDMSFALDQAAHQVLPAFVEELGRRHPLMCIAEGPGVIYGGEGSAGQSLRVLIDPVDGTRGLMHDLRSGWVLTGIAPDRGDETSLRDIEVAVQTELVPSWAATYTVLTAIRGQGAILARHDVKTGDELDRVPLVVDTELQLENGFFSFPRYLPCERPDISALETAFLERLVNEKGLDPRLLFEDQVLCTAGHLFYLVTGRYRFLADLRGWLGSVRQLENFAVRPYDLSSLLVFTEAGLPVLDANLQPLNGPLDTETPLSVVSFANPSLAEELGPALLQVMGNFVG